MAVGKCNRKTVRDLVEQFYVDSKLCSGALHNLFVPFFPPKKMMMRCLFRLVWAYVSLWSLVKLCVCARAIHFGSKDGFVSFCFRAKESVCICPLWIRCFMGHMLLRM